MTKSSSDGKTTSIGQLLAHKIRGGYKWLIISVLTILTLAHLCFCARNSLKPIYKSAKLELQYHWLTLKDDEFTDVYDNPSLHGKTILAIGDSQTAPGLWQGFLGNYLDMNVLTHAQGGADLISMVDGEDAESAPSQFDPSKFGVSKLYALSTKEVRDADFVILMGLYNERKHFTNACGKRTDMYPADTTFFGRFNYAVSRVRKAIKESGNNHCTLLFVTRHRNGSNAYEPLDAYKTEAFTDSCIAIAQYNHIPTLDLMRQSGIDSTNWQTYHNSNLLSEEEIKQNHPKHPENPDYLHLNANGQMKVARCVAEWMTEFE